MARSPRRAPTVQELDKRLTNVEHELAQVVSTVTNINRAATEEVKLFRDAFIEHRVEVRENFAKMATANELAIVKADVAAIRRDVTEILRRVSNGHDRGE